MKEEMKEEMKAYAKQKDKLEEFKQMDDDELQLLEDQIKEMEEKMNEILNLHFDKIESCLIELLKKFNLIATLVKLKTVPFSRVFKNKIITKKKTAGLYFCSYCGHPILELKDLKLDNGESSTL
ncbi:MAG: hypothetical protein GF383_09765 [Candidatus Lokiarchaeota archaeon]|nr:hypothetical protein [Candidatus Lokiarchaeota archaeon]MBD3340810.1 hypothetical protein [Candidatus Lokiarchaeota archaeon]